MRILTVFVLLTALLMQFGCNKEIGMRKVEIQVDTCQYIVIRLDNNSVAIVHKGDCTSPFHNKGVDIEAKNSKIDSKLRPVNSGDSVSWKRPILPIRK